jgi:hypothetical protein
MHLQHNVGRSCVPPDLVDYVAGAGMVWNIRIRHVTARNAYPIRSVNEFPKPLNQHLPERELQASANGNGPPFNPYYILIRANENIGRIWPVAIARRANIVMDININRPIIFAIGADLGAAINVIMLAQLDIHGLGLIKAFATL